MDSVGALDAGRVAEGPRQTIPIFVISLARATERRARTVTTLQRLGLSFELVEGVDGSAIPEAERRALLADGINYHPGVIGCYLAHLRAYRLMAERRIALALILEDDAILRSPIVPLLRQGLSWSDFDYCLLTHVGDNETGPTFYDLDTRQDIAEGVRTYRTHGAPAGLAAYFMSLASAERRLFHGLPIKRPIDIYSELPYRPHFRIVVGTFLAGIGETALRSSTSLRDDSGRLSFRGLRRLPGYYALRDLLSVDHWKLRLGTHALQRVGVLPAGRRWRPIPPGWRIIP